jgi:TonB family protein
MGYQALLFCPDEKTARTVTQVLSELEFSVEPCLEPFAAVKRLMGEHFDAVVVDCDNEQNATLLFKSARNSTSNHSSLAVAVVEGQAGVAKAFRIGANLVLTKPINVEQAKGTLRVARGLLRKGDPAKAAAASTALPMAAKSPAPAANPPAAVKPTAQAIPPAAAAPRPSAPATPKPASSPIPKPAVPARSAVASSAPHIQDEDPIEIILEDSTSPSAQDAAPIAPMAFKQVPALETAPAEAQLPVQAASPAGHSSPGFGSGAASAPARARIAPNVADQLFEATVAPEEKKEEAISAANVGSEPTFTFGGANAPAESSGGNKKALLAVAATVVVAAGLYAGWTQFHGKSNPSSDVPAQSASKPAVPAPVATSPAAQPAKVQPAPPSAPVPSSSGAATSHPESNTVLADNSTLAENSEPISPKHQPAPEKHGAAVPTANSAKTSAPSSAGKTASNSEPAAQPLVVKPGTAVPGHAKSAVPDAPAPSMIGLTPSASGGSLSNLVATGNAPQPVLQALNVSQGVSQGLLIKKIQPTYPPNALRMRVEGSVQLLATIGKTGNITAVKITSGDPLLARAAQDAVKQWKYRPYFLNGEPVEIQTQVTINFKLPR